MPQLNLADIPSLAAAAKAPKVLPDATIAFLMVTGLCSGMSIISCGFVIVTRGPSFNLTADQSRQRFLAFVSLLAAIFGTIGNSLQMGAQGGSVGNSVASFFFNWLVQVGFAGIAHNSIIRLITSLARTSRPDFIKQASRACLIFYILTVPVMTPTIVALVHPENSAPVKLIARDLNIALVVAVEALATTADLLLLRRFTMYKERGDALWRRMLKDMWIVYAAIWLSIAADIIAKVLRDKTGATIPDLAITNLTLSLRALAALMYGTTVRHAQDIYSDFSSSHGVYSLAHVQRRRPARGGHTANSDFVAAPGPAKSGIRSGATDETDDTVGRRGGAAVLPIKVDTTTETRTDSDTWVGLRKGHELETSSIV